MKREKYLIHLSHDHHHGLALARLLQDNQKDDLEIIEEKKEKLIKFFNEDLIIHFRKEEAIFRLIKSIDEKLDELVIQTIEEHRLLEELILSAQVITTTEKLFYDIGSLLKEHIRKEERILFPLIEEKATEDVLREISKIEL